MNVSFSILYQEPPKDDSINYDIIIFKIRMEKKLSLDNSNDVWIFLKTLVEGGIKKVLIDMADLNFIDSSGIGTMINTAKMLRQKGGDIVLIQVSPEIFRILELVNFQRFVRVFQSETDAVGYFREGKPKR